MSNLQDLVQNSVAQFPFRHQRQFSFAGAGDDRGNVGIGVKSRALFSNVIGDDDVEALFLHL